MTWAIYRLDEKELKKYWKVGIELSIIKNAKNRQIYAPSLSFWAC